MNLSKRSEASNHSTGDIVAMIAAVLIVAAATTLSALFFPRDSDQLMQITERLGTTAGLVSALSLAGLTFAGGTGRAKLILAKFSATLSVFFAVSYFLVIVLSLMCAIAPIWEDQEPFVTALVGATLGLMLVVAAGTTFILFGLLYQSTQEPPPPEPSSEFVPRMK